MINKVKLVTIDVIKTFSDKKIPRSAAALSYYLTLSFFPFLICLNWIVGLFDINIHEVAQVANGLIPQNTLEIMEKYMEYVSSSQSNTLLVAGATMFVTSLSAAFRSVIGSLEDVNGKKRSKGIWYYLIGFACAALFLFGTYLCMLISVTGKIIINFINMIVNFNLRINEDLPLLILFAYMFLMLTALYKLSQPKKFPIKRIWRGSLASAVGVVILSRVFSIFLEYSTKYSLVYGSLASVMLLMVWMFACSIVIISGNVLNHGLNSVYKEK